MIAENINQFCFNGKKSYDDMDLIITETPVFSCPKRDIEFTSVPGRSGDIISDNGRFENVTASYKVAALADDFNIELMLRKIKAWLAGAIGYCKLSDTYDPNYFRYAALDGKIDFTQKLRAIGEGTIKFNCKPFRYSTEGQQAIILTHETALYNPEGFESTPHIKIVGSGDITLYINNTAFSITSVDGNIEIDGDIMAAYSGTSLQNNKIHFTDFPKLAPGKNDISFIGSVSEIQITPRWCAL